MTVTPIKRTSVSEQVFEQMKSLILSGTWASGDRLPSEKNLADLFGVSRITVRHGIHRLVALGLAETHAGDGTYIMALSPGNHISNLIPTAYLSEDNMRSILEFRMAIEGYTAELAVRKADDNDIKRLELIIAEMEQKKEDIENFSEADFMFHYELAVISRNPLIIESYNLVRDLFRSSMRGIVEKRGSSHGLYSHRAIYSCIVSKDARGCRLAMMQHIETTYSDMMLPKDNE